MPAQAVRCRVSWSPLAVVAAAAATALLAVGCGSGGQAASPSPAATPMQLKVMEFNIEYGGTHVSFTKVAEAVKKAGPDVVGLEEAETNTGRLARLAGYPYYNTGLQVVSKYPILEPSGAQGAYAFIEVQPGNAIALSNVHLPSAPYGPNAIRNGKPAAFVLAMENKVRVPAIQPQLKLLPPLAQSGMSVFITGDFNSPSALDYTQAAVGSRPELKYVLDWPVGRQLLNAGFRDSFREIYPDPVAVPGLTWPSDRPKVSGWNPTAKDPRDRIDQIYAAGPSKTTASAIVGEKGNKTAAIQVSPWPSDHRAVVSTFTLTPAPLPVMVATDKWLYARGERIQVTYHTGPGDDWEVDLETYVKDFGSHGDAIQLHQASGTVSFPTSGSFATSSGDTKLRVCLVHDEVDVVAETPVWVKPPGASVELATDKTTYASGEPIAVSWLNAPANRWDWLGVYKASAADPNVDYYLDWQYTSGAYSGSVHGMPAGSYTFDATHHEGSPWPLPPGRYVVYYLLADAYQQVARADFTVTK